MSKFLFDIVRCQATPKTLEEAIERGLNNAHSQMEIAGVKEIAEVVRHHVKDYLSQKFSVYTLSENDKIAFAANALWDEINVHRR